MMIGEQMAEGIKLEIGSRLACGDGAQAEVRGRDMLTGLPKTIVLTTEEVRARCRRPVAQIIEAVKRTLEDGRPSSRPTSSTAASCSPAAARS